MNTVPCKSCGKPIFFAITDKGRRMPIDPVPTMTGTIIVTEHAGAEPTCVVAPLTHAGPKYLSHFATCPHADVHRKSSKNGKAARP